MVNKTQIIGIIIIGVIAGVVGIGGAYLLNALTNQKTDFNQQGTVEDSTLYVFTIDGTEVSNQSTIDWGTLQKGDNTLTYSVENVGTQPFTVYLYDDSINYGFTVTFPSNATVINTGQTVTDTLTVNVPETAIAQTYNWNSQLYAEQ